MQAARSAPSNAVPGKRLPAAERISTMSTVRVTVLVRRVGAKIPVVPRFPDGQADGQEADSRLKWRFS